MKEAVKTTNNCAFKSICNYADECNTDVKNCVYYKNIEEALKNVADSEE
jgi:hypothetical protein